MVVNNIDIKKDLLERFIRYVKINTQSIEGSDNVPSSENQHKLANLLYEELKNFGLKDVFYDKKHCYVYAKISSNRKQKLKNGLGPIAFIAHIDTSPESSGENVNPIIHKKYDGKIIKFPKNPTIILDPNESIALKNEIGYDIITSDGTTLLGADDKAGVAIIMTFAKILAQKDCDIDHDDIYIVFTPDEEVGNGTKFFDLSKCKAKFGYTLDGEDLGEINCETFNAYFTQIDFYGINTHPGTAYNRMQNTIYAVSYFLNKIPKNMRPETTKNRTGFFHPLNVEANVEHSTIKMIIRDFDEKKIKQKCEQLKNLIKNTQQQFPNIKIEYVLKEQYKNMKSIIKKHPKFLKITEEAIKLCGIKPYYKPIRGGTDGARLTFMGLPTLNLFAGMFNPHSKNEWASLRIMEYAVLTMLNVITLA